MFFFFLFTTKRTSMLDSLRNFLQLHYQHKMKMVADMIKNVSSEFFLFLFTIYRTVFPKQLQHFNLPWVNKSYITSTGVLVACCLISIYDLYTIICSISYELHHPSVKVFIINWPDICTPRKSNRKKRVWSKFITSLLQLSV